MAAPRGFRPATLVNVMGVSRSRVAVRLCGDVVPRVVETLGHTKGLLLLIISCLAGRSFPGLSGGSFVPRFDWRVLSRQVRCRGSTQRANGCDIEDVGATAAPGYRVCWAGGVGFLIQESLLDHASESHDGNG